MGAGLRGTAREKEINRKAGGCITQIIMLPFTIVIEIFKAIFGAKKRGGKR